VRKRCAPSLRLCILLFLSISASHLPLACVKNVARANSEAAVSWVCDPEADEAMKVRDYGTAILLHERFLEREGRNGLVLYHLGYAYGQTGDHEREAALYEEAISVGYSEAAIYFNLGMAYGEINRMEEAIRAFQNGVEMYPDNADNHLGLAMAYQKAGGHDALSEKAFLRAVEIDPNLTEARLYLTLLYMDMGELRKASDQLRKILDTDPANPTALELLERIEKQ